ncbi:murinoglobulin-1-like [Pelmatolapia mariae]|uniref:murinoglobulin-1-like n=1 Tax=Pelmatolapia mariae TaxID=158779 RepID=UPI003211D28A
MLQLLMRGLSQPVMDRLWILSCTLCVLLSWMHVDQAVAEPQYLVAIPAVIEAGAEAKFCATLRQPSGTLVMTVTLKSREKNTTLFTHTSNEAFQTCVQFKAPLVQKEVQDFQVEVRGDTFYSKQVRKVMIRASDTFTFIQTDKPIYLPGQKVNFRVVAMDNKMRPANQLYDVIELQDPNRNRIGQWLNETSNSRILQLSYSLDTEAREGPYQIIVSVGERNISHNFKVEKYVFPKYDVTLNISEEVLIGQEDIEAEVCAKYTYGQPVPGRVTVNVCRPINRYSSFSISLYDYDLLALWQMGGSCHTETKQLAEDDERQVWLSQEQKHFRVLSLLSKPTPPEAHRETHGETEIFQVLSRGAVIMQGQTQVQVQDRSVTEGQVSFKVRVSPEMAPEFQLVAYAVLPSEDVIAHSANFSTDKCFSNKVSVEFSPSSAVPGEETNMQVTALPRSLCGVSAIDKSVLIKEPGKTLDADKIFDLLPLKKSSGIPYEVRDAEECLNVRPKRYVLPYPGQEQNDAYAVFQKVGLKMATNLIFRLPSCLKFKGKFYHDGHSAIVLGYSPPVRDPIRGLSSLDLGSAGQLPPPIETARSFFPETWIWDLVEVGPRPLEDPAFPVYVGRVFRRSGAVNVTVSAEAVASHVSCDNEVVSVPDRGRIDVVTKSLIVKAEGTEMTKTYNWLLCPKGNTLIEEAEIHLPENVIEGSARTSVSVLGDILGRALKNLDGLLQMPHGCGEQNMALLAPNIYILHYLKGTQQLTTAIMEKATNFLTSGYQRQLNYKSDDGAYTTFGTGPGNTWLTAFVVRSFAKAQSFIYIDPRTIEESKTWLEHKQQETGCFEKSGKLFNNRMKGGVSDEVTLSAYVTAAFLEINTSQHDPVMKKSLACLKQSISDLSNTYTTALLAYVFTLAGDMETRAHLLQHLDRVAVREGGFLYWSQTAAEKSASLSVEISSYVLLAKLSVSPTAEDLAYASGIMRWLTGQQNYYGGFSSTQDTVVALQALALYSTLVFSPEGWSTVTVQAPSSQLTFDVNQGNKLLYQEEALQDVSGKYRLEVKGTACASVQISVHYNIPTPTDVTTLSVKVQLEVNTTSESARPKFSLKIQSLYSGKEKTTNMVILDIKMLSGFSPDPESLRSLKHGLLVSRVEQKEDHVLVYLEELSKDTPINHSLEITQELPVDNLKPAMVKLYDYYQPSDQAETQYIFTCSHYGKFGRI